MSAAVCVANAPCSYGVFDEGYSAAPNVPAPDTVLADVRAAGYDGIDLGPPVFLGEGAVLDERLRRHALALAGAYVELPLADRDAMPAALDALERRLDALEAPRTTNGAPQPRPTLADTGSAARAGSVGRAAADRAFGWDDTQWAVVAESVAIAVARCRRRGFEPTFHPHAGTHVEAAWEIERLMAVSNVGLCLDTGHLPVGGADVLDVVRRFAPRINHVHLKDVRGDVLAGLLADRPPVYDMWARGTFCALGEGIVPVADVLATLTDAGYRGWVVVEQDVLPEDAGALAAAIGAQPGNRERLRALGL